MMDNEIIAGVSGLPDGQPATQLINQGPDPQINQLNGDMIFNAIPQDLVEKMNVLFGLINTRGQQQNVSHAMEWASLSHERFCLFVLDNENYKDGWFAISKDRALSKYTPYSDYFLPLNASLRAEIMQMPCIFAKRNLRHASTSDDHPVLYGKLTEINPQGSVIRFHYEHFKVERQQTINKHMEKFGLLQRPLHNQLDEEHWCIRSGNLQKTLDELNIIVEYVCYNRC